MKCNVQQAEKESEVLKKALFSFDKWLTSVENNKEEIHPECDKSKELRFLTDMCDRVETYFDVTSIRRLLLMLEHRFEKVKGVLADKNTITYPRGYGEINKSKMKSQTQHEIQSKTRDKKNYIVDEHMTQKHKKKGSHLSAKLSDMTRQCTCPRKFLINEKRVVERNGVLFRSSVGKKGPVLLQDFLNENDPCRRKTKSGKAQNQVRHCNSYILLFRDTPSQSSAQSWCQDLKSDHNKILSGDPQNDRLSTYSIVQFHHTIVVLKL